MINRRAVKDAYPHTRERERERENALQLFSCSMLICNASQANDRYRTGKLKPRFCSDKFDGKQSMKYSTLKFSRGELLLLLSSAESLALTVWSRDSTRGRKKRGKGISRLFLSARRWRSEWIALEPKRRASRPPSRRSSLTDLSSEHAARASTAQHSAHHTIRYRFYSLLLYTQQYIVVSQPRKRDGKRAVVCQNKYTGIKYNLAIAASRIHVTQTHRSASTRGSRSDDGSIVGGTLLLSFSNRGSYTVLAQQAYRVTFLRLLNL